jgi:hypothetical protein
MSGFTFNGDTKVSVVTASANGVVANADADARNTVLLLSNTDLYWESGPSSVTATNADKFLPAGVGLVVRLPKGHDNIGAIRDSADGVLTIYTVV